MDETRERAELEDVLASTLFARAPDLCKILRFVCEKHFSKQADTIKEYSIAVQALGRGPDFRPDEDSIVRVQAARLRKHLRRYYETDGANHSIQIRISASGYRPEFVSTTHPGGRTADAPQPYNVICGSDSAGGPDTGMVLDQPGASPSHPPKRKRVLMWGLVATASIVAIVGASVKYRSVVGSTEPLSSLPAAPAASPGINIRAGFSGQTFLDVTGKTWLGDRYFSGGEAFSRADSPILRTFDQALYQTGRRGIFSYSIPLQQGFYEMHLHFAEVFFSPAVGADTQRTFDVSINGARALTGFDIAKDAGGTLIADEKIFKDISPGKDGLLRLDFTSGRSQALLNGIELLPGIRRKMEPIRILCSNHPYLDKNGWLWKADRYFFGGRISELAVYIQDPNFGGFSSYRTGNFNYAIPVADGRYRIRLIFAEPVHGRSGGSGEDRRLFDVYCNGKTLLSRFDIFKEAGSAYRVIESTFRHVKPDAQGKILLSFVPVKDYAVLLAIEVIDEDS